MDLNKIHYFFRAAELKNFTKAAQECHIAQTTMSKYISTLEQELHLKLFIRDQKSLMLTSQGQRFYEGMKDISLQYQGLCQKLMKNESRELHIGVATTDYTDFKIIESFEKKYPSVYVSYVFSDEEKLLMDLKSSKLDAFICPDMLEFYHSIREQVEELSLARIKVSLVCSKKLIDRYHTIENVISHVPFITKAKEENYHNFCKEELYSQFHQTFHDTIVVKEFPKQLLLLSLSHGFSILPEEKIRAEENLLSFEAGGRFTETEKLICMKSNPSESLRLLLKHCRMAGNEKKC